MNKMLTFNSFVLVPSLSNIMSRKEVDISTKMCGMTSELPIINANMHSICTFEMIDKIDKNNSFSSYHRFFSNKYERKDMLEKCYPSRKNIFISIGTKKEEYDFIDSLYELGFRNVIIDVNHGHHTMVADVLQYIKKTHKDIIVMAGNVSSSDGIKFLRDYGADIIKIGNSFGFSCTTIKASGFGVHPIHVAREYRNTGDWDTPLCIDGGIKEVADIAKSLIWGNIVMVGKMLAGCDESNGRKIVNDKGSFVEYYGNASVTTKKIAENNHIKYIEGTTKLVPYNGPMSMILDSIKEGVQSAFSFVGARNLKEFQENAKNQILFV